MWCGMINNKVKIMRYKRKNKKKLCKKKNDIEDVPTEILSQNEIDQLLTAINLGYTEPEEFRPISNAKRIKIYDFKRPDRFTKEQIRTISIMHELFSRESSNQFSALLKNYSHVHVASVDQLTYEEFTRSIPTPTTVIPIEMKPIGKIIVEIDPAITFAIINRMFGGDNDEIFKAQHELTEIEKISMQTPVNLLLKSLQNIWKNNSVSLDIFQLSIDTMPQFIQITHPTEMGILVTCEIKIDEVEGMINIFYPYFTLETILNKLTAKNWYKRYYIQKSIPKTPNLIDVELCLRALLFRKEISIGELSNKLLINAVIPLEINEKINLFMANETRTLFYFETCPEEDSICKKIKLLNKINIMEKNYMNEKHNTDKISTNLNDVNVQLSVELGRKKMLIKDVLQLGEGSIIELDSLAGEPASLFANNVMIAKGEIIVVDENYGIRIIDILTEQQQQQF
jgi:flagellar motor switch protein FliM